MDVVGLSYQHHQQDHPGDADVLAPAAAEAPQPDNAAQPATSQFSGTTSLPEDAKQPQAGPVPDSEVPEGDTNGNAKTDPGERPLGSKVVYVDDGNGNAVPPAGTSPEDAGLEPTGNYVGAMCPVYKNPYTGEEYTLPPVGNTEKEWFPVGILSVKN